MAVKYKYIKFIQITKRIYQIINELYLCITTVHPQNQEKEPLLRRTVYKSLVNWLRLEMLPKNYTKEVYGNSHKCSRDD